MVRQIEGSRLDLICPVCHIGKCRLARISVKIRRFDLEGDSLADKAAFLQSSRDLLRQHTDDRQTLCLIVVPVNVFRQCPLVRHTLGLFPLRGDPGPADPVGTVSDEKAGSFSQN